MQFRNTSYGISTYFTYKFPKESISKIFPGPENKTLEWDIRRFLGAHDYPDDIEIEYSAVPYRDNR